MKSEGEYFPVLVRTSTLPRHFVAVRTNHFETHKLIALQAADQNRLFRPTIKLEDDYYVLAHREELLRGKNIRIQFGIFG